jgi:hypothetical protein
MFDGGNMNKNLYKRVEEQKCNNEKITKQRMKDNHIPEALAHKFCVFKEYTLEDHSFVYDYVMSTNSLNVAKDFVKAIAGVMRTYSIVITDREYNLLLRYPPLEVFIN